MKRLAIFLALFVSPMACKKALNTTPGPDETVKGIADRNNVAGGGVIHDVRKSVGSTVNANDLHNLKLFLEAASGASGQLPDKETIMASLKNDPNSRKLVKAIDEGLIVLTGNRQRESIWAYEKDATMNGGWTISNNGVDKMTAVQLNQALGKKKS